MSTPISIITNGTTVHGLITHRSHSDLTVTITSPISGFSNEAPHIPYFARSHRDYRSALGDSISVELLTELYAATSCVEARQNALRDKLHQPGGLLEVLARIKKDHASLTHKKQEAKTQFNEGLLTQKAYQALLKELRLVSESLASQETDHKAEFMKLHLPEYCTALSIDELLLWLQTT